METQYVPRHVPRPLSRRLLWLAGIALMGALLLLSKAGAQETPDATDEGQATPVTAPTDGTQVFLELEAPTGEPVNKGDTFLVHLMVADVEDLSAFDFQISYDRDRIEPIVIDEGEDAGTVTTDGDLGAAGGDQNVEGELGEFLVDSPRGSLCSGPFIRPASRGTVFGLCAGVALPVCLDGPAGIDGSGRLGTVVFKSKGGDSTDIVLAQSNLASDDADPCDPQGSLTPIKIPHTNGGALTVQLTGGGGTSIWLVAVIAIVVVAVIGAGLVGFLLFQRRGRTTT